MTVPTTREGKNHVPSKQGGKASPRRHGRPNYHTIQIPRTNQSANQVPDKISELRESSSTKYQTTQRIIRGQTRCFQVPNKISDSNPDSGTKYQTTTSSEPYFTVAAKISSFRGIGIRIILSFGWISSLLLQRCCYSAESFLVATQRGITDCAKL